MRYQGRITRWNDNRGFGFISPNGSRNLVFVHVKAFADRPQRPVINELVYYELSDDQLSRAHAENVTFVSDDPAAEASRRWSLPVVTAAVFLFLIVASAVGGAFFLYAIRF